MVRKDGSYHSTAEPQTPHLCLQNTRRFIHVSVMSHLVWAQEGEVEHMFKQMIPLGLLCTDFGWLQVDEDQVSLVPCKPRVLTTRRTEDIFFFCFWCSL